MIDDGANVLIDIRIEVTASLTMINATGNHVPKVWDHTSADDDLAFGIEINSPGIAKAMSHHFKAILIG